MKSELTKQQEEEIRSNASLLASSMGMSFDEALHSIMMGIGSSFGKSESISRKALTEALSPEVKGNRRQRRKARFGK